MSTVYVNYKKASAEYDLDAGVFALGWSGAGTFLKQGSIRGVVLPDKRVVSIADYRERSARAEDLPDGRRLLVRYGGGPDHLRSLDLEFLVSAQGITFIVRLKEDWQMLIDGALSWGGDMRGSTFACRLDRKGGDLRMASGPGASSIDNCLFDRLTDSALEITGAGDLRMRYDWQEDCYRFSLNTGTHLMTNRIRFAVRERYFQDKFAVPYRPVTGETQFKTPPVGWMTWYAVKFEASEKTVLENTRWLSENLGRFGANCLWIDWEWYHSSRTRSADEYPDIDTFHPDPRRYPKGPGFLADEIKRHGLVPAIWIGATNDPNKNEWLAAHPQCILTEQVEWCGRWWVDPSHPEVIDDYVPRVFQQLVDWGYEAIKWDCLPVSQQVADQHHARFNRPDKSSEEALRDVVAAARRVIGPGRYMMSCSGQNNRAITFAIDLFDGGRIGGDIFGWEDYVHEAVAPTLRYMCFHNILFYADLDNVVVRGEYNTMDQARSRVSFTALTGTPVTLGDHLPALESERVELLKRIMPVADIHPMDLDRHVQDTDLVVMNLVVAREFEQWNVVDVFNTTDKERTVSLDLVSDLHLDRDGRYLLFDFWREEFLGSYSGAVHLTLPAFGSTVLSVRRAVDAPQILSTSRHVTQGAVDLQSVAWNDAEAVLAVKSETVAEDPYKAYLHVPEGLRPRGVQADRGAKITGAGGNVWVVSLDAAAGGPCEWKVTFEKASRAAGAAGRQG